MRRLSLSTGLATLLTVIASLAVATSGAQAVVVDMNPASQGQPTVNYPTDLGSYYGVDVVPGTRADLLTAGIPTVSSAAPCTDPSLGTEWTLPSTGLCSHGGPVVHASETFVLDWDYGISNYAAPYVEQYLRNVADGSGTLTSPYSDMTQYTDGSGRAANSFLYGGGYDDANAYPTSACTPSGTHHFAGTFGGTLTDVPNSVCLDDAQLRSELTASIVQNGLVGRIQPGHTPEVVLLTPPGVETCIDSGASLCSANSDPNTVPAQFCSYHSQINVGGTLFNYIVQPWTAQTDCDETDATPAVPPGPAIDLTQLTNSMGARLVDPLSQAQIATQTNPGMTGWFALDGSEINDNGCAPLTNGLDNVTVANTGYVLQREFNNGGVLIDDPFSSQCIPWVNLNPQYVVPSPINAGDVVEFDGSKTRSDLLVPHDNYVWSFGDGTTAIGPSVVHSYPYAGTYTTTLTVTDRGGNVASVSQQEVVIGTPAPNPLQVPAQQPSQAGSPGSGSHTVSVAIRARIQLVPQGLGAVLNSGLAIRVSSNVNANGIVTVSIPAKAAKRAHIKVARHASSVVIGRGTVSEIKSGTVTLHLKLSRTTAAKLKKLAHLNLSVRLALVAPGGRRMAIDAAGSY
jgi:hypothetical protein